jgi:hypothetical protein
MTVKERKLFIGEESDGNILLMLFPYGSLFFNQLGDNIDA